MADNNQSEDIGKYARHPLRTMGMGFIIGSAVGASMMAAKKNQEKNIVDKFLDRLSK